MAFARAGISCERARARASHERAFQGRWSIRKGRRAAPCERACHAGRTTRGAPHEWPMPGALEQHRPNADTTTRPRGHSINETCALHARRTTPGPRPWQVSSDCVLGCRTRRIRHVRWRSPSPRAFSRPSKQDASAAAGESRGSEQDRCSSRLMQLVTCERPRTATSPRPPATRW